jgi:regulator of chromosome condensation
MSSRASKRRAASPAPAAAAKKSKKAAPAAAAAAAAPAAAAPSVLDAAVALSGLDRVPAGEKGTVFAFGSGDCSQLGLGADENMRERKKPTLLKALAAQNVVAIAAGSLHNLVLVGAERAVWSWGCNDDQALGRSTDEWLPAPVNGPLGKGATADLAGGVVQIACGASHSIALTGEGDVYSWGTYRDANGVIGFSDSMEAATVPERLTVSTLHKGVKIVQIAAGEHHDALLTEQGEGQHTKTRTRARAA